VDFFVAFGLALLLTPAARRVGVAAGVVDRPDDAGLKIHAGAIPLLGGAAVLAAALTAPAFLGDAVPGAIVAATLVGFAAGMADDLRPLPPWPRLVVQAGAGVLLAAGGARLGLDGAAGFLGVIVLAVALTNAVNLLDGQDGLAGGVAAIGALGLGGLAALEGSGAQSLAFAAAGGLGGFLIWNRPPARIFLGNGGAYAVGMLLAAPAASVSQEGWRGTFAATLCLAVPAFELAFTAARRLAGGESLGAGDRRHSYDLLSRRTGRGRATVWFCAAASACVGLSFAVHAVPVGAGAAIVGAVAGAAGVWGRWFWKQQQDLVGS